MAGLGGGGGGGLELRNLYRVVGCGGTSGKQLFTRVLLPLNLLSRLN